MQIKIEVKLIKKWTISVSAKRNINKDNLYYQRGKGKKVILYFSEIVDARQKCVQFLYYFATFIDKDGDSCHKSILFCTYHLFYDSFLSTIITMKRGLLNDDTSTTKDDSIH